MTHSHHNTTDESGATLGKFEAKALSQEEIVFAYFTNNPFQLITRSELHKIILSDCPVSSITRALANLKKRNLIERTTEKRDGEFGRPMFCWRLAINDSGQGELL